MKASAFDLYRPRTLEEALSLLTEHRDDVKVLAGGQSLVPLLNFRLARPAVVVDIGLVPGLDGIEVESETGGLRVGSMARHSEVEHSDVVEAACPLLSRAMGHIAHPPIRNRGTLGGSLAHGDPAAELPAVALALDAVLVAVSTRGTREINVADFYQGFLTTTLAEDELLVAVRFPLWPARTGAAFSEVSRRRGDFAMVGVAVAAGTDPEGRLVHLKVAFSGVSDVPVRALEVEHLLLGSRFEEEDQRLAVELVQGSLNPPDDLHGTSDYRKSVAATLMVRSIAEAIRAGNVPTSRQVAS
jgi:aerobic carbon-monoxide dehydrogenase medium subunit